MRERINYTNFNPDAYTSTELSFYNSKTKALHNNTTVNQGCGYLRKGLFSYENRKYAIVHILLIFSQVEKLN